MQNVLEKQLSVLLATKILQELKPEKQRVTPTKQAGALPSPWAGARIIDQFMKLTGPPTLPPL